MKAYENIDLYIVGTPYPLFIKGKIFSFLQKQGVHIFPIKRKGLVK